MCEVTAFGGVPPRALPDPTVKVTRWDDEDLGRAFDAHRAELTGFARRELANTDLAEEVVQETFVRAWRSRARFDPAIGSLRSWLFSIERNLLIDLGRSRTRRETIERTVLHRSEAVVDEVETQLTSWQVADAIDRLTPEHRAVLLGIYFDGHTSKEVAARLAIAEGTVRSRLYYALRALRAILETTGWEG